MVKSGVTDWLVSNYVYDSNGNFTAVSLAGTYNTSKLKLIAGGGGLVLSTIKDYWCFAQMILNDGEFEGKRYLKASTVQMMHTNAPEPGTNFKFYNKDIKGLGFGLGYQRRRELANGFKATSGSAFSVLGFGSTP